jgi:hypothetical protein
MRNKVLWFAVVLLFPGPGEPLALKASLQGIKALIEGAYTLQEWHAGEGVLHPPAVDGRFVLRDGVVATILKNWSQPGAKVSAANYGRYSFDSSGFSYSYEDATAVTETPSEAKVSHKLLFEGTRSFTASRDANGVRLRRAEENVEFFFTPELLTYSENGKVLRVWKRVQQDKQNETRGGS